VISQLFEQLEMKLCSIDHQVTTPLLNGKRTLHFLKSLWHC